MIKNETKTPGMNSVICSLFEGNHHYGIAALANSLYDHNFKGAFFVGYRGQLPKWTNAAKQNVSLQWEGAKTLEIAENFQIHFLPLDVVCHLSSYKPVLMLRLLEGPAKEAKGIIYFDPDITIKCNWEFYENWIGYGVAVVQEVISNPMPASHPLRLGWEKVIKGMNKETKHKLNYYFNSGFCGVAKENVEFLQLWAEIILLASNQYGLDANKFVSSSDRTKDFNIIDQDAFNITAMCSESPICEVGPDGMNFLPGGWIMSHAAGSPKPWRKSYIRLALKGYSPSRADHDFWLKAKGPIKNFSNGQIKFKELSMSIAGFIGRFYSRK